MSEQTPYGNWTLPSIDFESFHSFVLFFNSKFILGDGYHLVY